MEGQLGSITLAVVASADVTRLVGVVWCVAWRGWLGYYYSLISVAGGKCPQPASVPYAVVPEYEIESLRV